MESTDQNFPETQEKIAQALFSLGVQKASSLRFDLCDRDIQMENASIYLTQSDRTNEFGELVVWGLPEFGEHEKTCVQMPTGWGIAKIFTHGGGMNDFRLTAYPKNDEDRTNSENHLRFRKSWGPLEQNDSDNKDLKHGQLLSKALTLHNSEFIVFQPCNVTGVTPNWVEGLIQRSDRKVERIIMAPPGYIAVNTYQKYPLSFKDHNLWDLKEAMFVWEKGEDGRWVSLGPYLGQREEGGRNLELAEIRQYGGLGRYCKYLSQAFSSRENKVKDVIKMLDRRDRVKAFLAAHGIRISNKEDVRKAAALLRKTANLYLSGKRKEPVIPKISVRPAPRPNLIAWANEQIIDEALQGIIKSNSLEWAKTSSFMLSNYLDAIGRWVKTQDTVDPRVLKRGDRISYPKDKEMKERLIKDFNLMYYWESWLPKSKGPLRKAVWRQIFDRNAFISSKLYNDIEDAVRDGGDPEQIAILKKWYGWARVIEKRVSSQGNLDQNFNDQSMDKLVKIMPDVFCRGMKMFERLDREIDYGDGGYREVFKQWLEPKRNQNKQNEVNLPRQKKLFSFSTVSTIKVGGRNPR